MTCVEVLTDQLHEQVLDNEVDRFSLRGGFNRNENRTAGLPVKNAPIKTDQRDRACANLIRETDRTREVRGKTAAAVNGDEHHQIV